LWVEGEISSSFLPVKICHFHITNHLDQLSMLFRISLVLALALAGNPGRMVLSADERRNETHVDGDQVDLGVTVLSGLGGGHLFSPHIRRFASHPRRIESTPVLLNGIVRYMMSISMSFRQEFR
jgi:hypothetical protein